MTKILFLFLSVLMLCSCKQDRVEEKIGVASTITELYEPYVKLQYDKNEYICDAMKSNNGAVTLMCIPKE